MIYEVIVVPRVRQDADDIMAWLWDRSPDGAVTWFSRCQSAINELAEIADHCHFVLRAKRPAARFAN